MGLSTKDLTEKRINKILEPGNNECKILSVKLEEMPYKKGVYHLNLQVEGPDLGPEFEGFYLDKDDPLKGKYKGQCGRLRSSEYPFSDGETKSGIKVSRDREIMKFIKNLSGALGKADWFEAQDNAHETIEAFVTKFNEDAPFKDIYLNVCIGGREYTNREGYTNYDLFLPRATMKAYPFESKKVPEDSSKLMKFNPDKHIIKKKAKTVESFDKPVSTQTKDSFSLD